MWRHGSKRVEFLYTIQVITLKYCYNYILHKCFGNLKAKIIDTQNIKRKKLKYTFIENHHITKENSKRGRKEQGTMKQTENNYKMATAVCTINYYFKYKWIKFSSQKTECLMNFKNKTNDPAISCLPESHFSFRDTHSLKMKG